MNELNRKPAHTAPNWKALASSWKPSGHRGAARWRVPVVKPGPGSPEGGGSGLSRSPEGGGSGLSRPGLPSGGGSGGGRGSGEFSGGGGLASSAPY